MSPDDEPYSADSDQDGHAQTELARLNALHDDLVEAVQTAINPTVRADLASELRSVRERIAELSLVEGTDLRRTPEPGATLHSYELPSMSGNDTSGEYAYNHDPEPRYADGRYPGAGRVPEGDPNLGRAPTYGYTDPVYGQPGLNPGSADPAWGRQPGGAVQARPQTSFTLQNEPERSFWSSRPWLPLMLAIVGGLALAALIGFGGLFRDGGDEGVASTEQDIDPAAAAAADAAISDIRSMLDGMGFASVLVENREGSVALVGSVANEADRQAVIGAAQALAGGLPFDSSGLAVGDPGQTQTTVEPSSPAAAMQRELERVLAQTPITFAEGQVAVTERHQLILNNVVSTMSAYPGQAVTILGFTDDQGSLETNERVASARAQNVRDYLVGQGVSADLLTVEAVGEAEATGVAGLGPLERRVEFQVAGTAVPGGEGLRVGLVAPSASNDLAFTQSMVDALGVVAGERALEVSITDSTFVESDAEAAMRDYAESGYDLVIAHGSQFGGIVKDLAPQFPETAFAWGTASVTYDLPNVYAYDAKAEQGGYVLGAIASRLSDQGTLGVVGPFEVGDAALYINGFAAGATEERPGTEVRIEYIESFSEAGLAAESATGHVAAGADVLTGSAQMVAGAVEVAATEGVPWFGTQANQTSLAPDLVVASQVYHWEVVLRPILDDVTAGELQGEATSLTLANGGLVLEFNDAYDIDPALRERATELEGEIGSGAVTPPGS